MNLTKMIRLMAAAGILASGLFVTSSIAQPGHASWYGNNGRHLGWTNGRHRGWDNGRGWRARNVVYYRPARYRYYRYSNYYPNYGYRRPSILSVIFGNSGYRRGYYYRPRGHWGDRRWRKYNKHHRRWDRDD